MINEIDMKNKILIADDNAINYQLLSEILKDKDIELLWAKNGEEAVTKYKENPDIKIVLMDINMPIMNGNQAADKIKELNNDVPIIGITGCYGMSISGTSLDECLYKPISGGVLLDVIDCHVKNLCDELLQRESEKESLWAESEKELIHVLSGVAELLKMSDNINKNQFKEIENKLNEIKSVLNQKSGK